MLEIKNAISLPNAVLEITGRLDTVTAPDLAEAVANLPKGLSLLTFDLKGLDYVSSAGLRVILQTHKEMEAAGGKLVISGANENILSIFALTGFSDILNLK